MSLGPAELLLIAGLPVLIVVLCMLPVSTRSVRRWASDRGVGLTPESERLIHGYLTRGRRLRTLGVIAGLVVPAVVNTELVNHGDPNGSGLSWLGILIGYLAGTVIAEVATARPTVEGPRTASLTPRDLPTYVPGFLRLSLRVVGIGGAGVWALAWWAFRHPATTREYTPPHAGGPGTWAWAGGFLLVVVVVELLQRWILGRPQPFLNADLVAADDAIRSQSVQVVGGTSIAVLLGCSVAPLVVISADTVQPLKAVAAIAAALSFFGAIWFWRSQTNKPWSVRRANADAAPLLPAQQ